MTNLADRLDSFPEPWKPAHGEKLVGELTDLAMRDSEYGDPYPILTVLDDDGREWAWHAFHAMARNEVSRKRPRIGERVGISYHGRGVAAPGMNPPERWRFLIDRTAEEEQQVIDWGPAPAEGDAEAGEGEAPPGGDPPDDSIPFEPTV